MEKRLKQLEERVAALERRVQEQPIADVDGIINQITNNLKNQLNSIDKASLY